PWRSLCVFALDNLSGVAMIPVILIDPTERQIERSAVDSRFWTGVKNAAMGTIGAALLLILTAWCLFT
ncbi:hypothetical protein, partial [Acidiphilium sp.]|uniref:hypothetical protein n=1 Tax=Acidiphilium sp. TaxID=527 RepID=UPI003D01D2CF